MGKQQCHIAILEPMRVTRWAQTAQNHLITFLSEKRKEIDAISQKLRARVDLYPKNSALTMAGYRAGKVAWH